MSEDKNKLRKIREEKLNSFSEDGVKPYPAKFEGRIENIKALEKGEGEKAKVAGRLMSKRVMGKSAFAHIQDATGKIQIYLTVDKLDDDRYDFFKDMDIGDFIGVEGGVFETRTGEKTVLVENFKFLSKSLRPLPEKWHKLKDKETRYRKRYLDILVNKESSKILKARSNLLSSVRSTLEGEDFIEVETPILQKNAGGAAAQPFKTHHNTFDQDLYLRIAPELFLKRLIVGGWDRVFEIGRNFRNEGISTRHNPEFTMMEVYCAYKDYSYMMKLAKDIVVNAANALEKMGLKSDIDCTGSWAKKDLWQLLKEYTGTEFNPEDSFSVLKEKADKLNVPPGKDSQAKILDRIFSKFVEPELIEPTFVTGYLAKDSPLAKRSSKNPVLAERFELFINGQEIGNAYSEQNDPRVQKEMFERQVAEDGGKIDREYIEALEYGMPPAAGLGIGIDRLTMLLTGKESIREVILFPMLKSKNSK
ncbi:MAG: lysine--tRNA ligase [Elusimicrobiota bacterium]